MERLVGVRSGVTSSHDTSAVLSSEYAARWLVLVRRNHGDMGLLSTPAELRTSMCVSLNTYADPGQLEFVRFDLRYGDE